METYVHQAGQGIFPYMNTNVQCLIQINPLLHPTQSQFNPIYTPIMSIFAK